MNRITILDTDGNIHKLLISRILKITQEAFITEIHYYEDFDNTNIIMTYLDQNYISELIAKRAN